MKYIVFLLIVLIGGIAYGQVNVSKDIQIKKSIKLSGKITKVNIQKNKYSSSETDIQIYLDMSLINNGSKNIIFPTKPIRCNRIKILKANGEVIDDFLSPGSSLSPRWEEITKQLDKNEPSQQFTTIVKKNNYLTFDYDWTFNLPTQKTQIDLGENTVVIENISYNELLKASPVFLQLQCPIKPIGRNENDEIVDGDDFWLSLSQKWSSLGYLWIDDIVSEPILFDLGSAIIKTEEK